MTDDIFCQKNDFFLCKIVAWTPPRRLLSIFLSFVIIIFWRRVASYFSSVLVKISSSSCSSRSTHLLSLSHASVSVATWQSVLGKSSPGGAAGFSFRSSTVCFFFLAQTWFVRLFSVTCWGKWPFAKSLGQFEILHCIASRMSVAESKSSNNSVLVRHLLSWGRCATFLALLRV